MRTGSATGNDRTASTNARWRARGAHLAAFTTLSAFAVFCAFPFYWMLITTFKDVHDLIDTANNPFVFNLPPTLENLRVLFQETQYARWLVNTLLVGCVVVAITLVLAVPAGYSLARLAGRRGRQLAIAIFVTYLIPPTILFIPFSRIIGALGLQDSLWSLVLVYPSFTVPFCSWLMMGFFKAVPRDIEEAAMMDGLSRFGAFLKVVVPLSSAGILTVVIFTLTLVMQEFVYALTFITRSSQYTVGVGVPTFLVRGDVYFWGSLMGACLIVSLPVAVLYNVFLDRFVAAFTVGAVK
ncbi:ABC transporter permease subunit [Burkholderia sp. 4701]|nr:ABC transporter permease subunit [Burkholderia sp. 4701]MXN84742.1 ABC transporter permease subunit [Burkholderia sp. 4812]